MNLNKAKIDENIVDILSGLKGDWKYQSIRQDIFEEYIKQFLKELNAECKKKGWKPREKLVRYEPQRGGGKCFCIISPKSRVILSMNKKFDLREYIDVFEKNKTKIRTEAMKFLAEYPTWEKKYETFIEDIMKVIVDKPAFIVKEEVTYTTQVLSHEILFTLRYRNWKKIMYFDLYKDVSEYDLKKVCRNLSSNIQMGIMCSLASYIEKRGKTITEAEEDAMVKYMIKQEHYYVIKALIDKASKKLKEGNLDKLSAYCTVQSILRHNAQLNGNPF